MDFVAYLISKNIDNQRFEASEKTLFDQWAQQFMQMNPKSFTLQKLFIINDIRRKYQLHIGPKPKDKPVNITPKTEAVAAEAVAKSTPRPLFKKPTTNTGNVGVNTETANNIMPEPLVAQAHTPKTEEGENLESAAENPKKSPIKPVFKRPEGTGENTSEKEKNSTTASEKKPMPKPVFKRAGTTVTQVEKSEDELAEDKPVAPIVKKQAPKPVFKRPASDTEQSKESNSEATHQDSPTPPVESVPQPKKPMSKPVFKRPDQPKKED